MSIAHVNAVSPVARNTFCDRVGFGVNLQPQGEHGRNSYESLTLMANVTNGSFARYASDGFSRGFFIASASSAHVDLGAVHAASDP